VFVAGQGSENQSGELPPEFCLQVRCALDNLATALAGAGAETRHIAKLTILVVGHTEEKLRVIASELERVLGGGPAPTCTLIPVPRLALDGMLFEVEALAVLPSLREAGVGGDDASIGR
jgi:enamine deaminase RidA (YjgF/YER057c/UK114 family)